MMSAGNKVEVETLKLPFSNRQQAGKELAARLSHHRGSDSLILAIPRGGVVVAAAVASELDIPLDVIVARKLGAPGHPEFAIGAVACWGDHDIILDDNTVRNLHISQEYIKSESDAQLAEVGRRIKAYRGTAEPPDAAGKHIILIDDGIATGHTIMAAAMALRSLDASSVTLAAPVAPAESLRAIKRYVDELICLETPDPFIAVGRWYVDFEQTSDEEVISILNKFRSNQR